MCNGGCSAAFTEAQVYSMIWEDRGVRDTSEYIDGDQRQKGSQDLFAMF